MSEPLAHIEHELVGDGLQIRLVGEIDLSNATVLRHRIERLIADARPDRVFIDLSEIGYLDSQGVMLLLEVTSTLRQTGTPLRLIAPRDSVAGELLAIAHLDELPVEGLTGDAQS